MRQTQKGGGWYSDSKKAASTWQCVATKGCKGKWSASGLSISLKDFLNIFHTFQGHINELHGGSISFQSI